MKNFKALLLVSLVVFGAGCSGASRRKAKVSDTSAASQKGSEDGDSAAIPDINVQEASLRGKDFQTIDGLQAIYFEYDSASLKDAQLALLKKNAESLKGMKGVEVLIAGFCDDRGTTEYNLALGQKRAKEVREYYIRLGVPGKSLATISYGKESPVCSEQTEDCWAKNRRAETRVRLAVSDNGRNGSGKQPQ